ncbi:major facilitator superfamily domain-containing protein [Xylariaceae sp. FL0255]|nr:major facilitator superfamily domain-containing protein [Xylariaceae sp. FL0255]
MSEEKQKDFGEEETRASSTHQSDNGKSDLEKQQSHQTDTDVDSDSTTSADEEGTGVQPSHPGSRSLSRAVSETEVRDGIQNQRDPELGPPLEEKITTTAPNPNDPDLVTWTGPDDPDNPKNWSYSRKWAAVFTVSLFTLISPVSSSLVAPGLNKIGEDLHITSDVEKNLTLSIFILAYAVGPLFWGPLSEVYGRVPVLQLVNLIYFVFNLGCGFAKTPAQLITFRFLSGLGGSAPQAIGGGVLGDLFTAEERGKALALYSLAPLLGPAIGPIAGAFISQRTTWRWGFYATTIADGVIQIAGLWFLQESYTPVLLTRKKNRLIKETGNDNLHTPYDDPNRSLAKSLRVALVRPFHMIGTQIMIQTIALYLLYIYGIIYIVLTYFPTLYSSPPPLGYGMPLGLGGLNYIALGIGFFLGSQVCAPCQDRIYAALKRRYGGVGRPEYRVPMMVPGAILVPVGLVIYGWTAEYKLNWIGPDIGALLFSMGAIMSFQCLQGFLVDAYTRYAASAVAAATVLRSLAGFGFPLFAPALYNRLGQGWGNTLLAFIGVVIGWPGPYLLWRYGPALRKRSTFAAGSN